MRPHLLLIVVACGNGEGLTLDTGSATNTKTTTTTDTNTDTKPATAPADARVSVDAVSKSSPIDGDPTMTVIERAFRNQRPAFPLLSKDGQTAVVDLRTRSHPKGWITYAVEILAANTPKPSERVTLVDVKLMETIHTKLDTAALAMRDIRILVKAAKRINERVKEEGFTRLEGQLEKVTVKGVAAGSFQVSQIDGDGLVVKVKRRGWHVETPRLEAEPMPRVGSIDCVAHPVLRRVFFDDARKRVLVHIGWDASADQCSLPDDRYHLVGPST